MVSSSSLKGSLTLSVSSSVTLVSILRLYILCTMLTSDDPDINYTIGPSIAIIECNLAIMTACAPTLWPLARRLKSLGVPTNASSLRSRCTHCYYENHHNTVHRSHPWTRLSGERPPHMPSMLHTRSFGTDTMLTAPRSMRRAREMSNFETSNSAMIMSVYQGLRETCYADRALEPETKISPWKGRRTWPDAASLEEYETGVLMAKLNRMSDQAIEQDSVLVNMGGWHGERIWDYTSDKVGGLQV